MENGRKDFSGQHEPVYLLSLDGGGVRGISEAVILHEIMTRIQKERGLERLPKPCDYFHIIGGTSTGGLIAIMLGRLRMSTQEVIDEYMAISSKIFSKKNRRLDKSFKEGKLEKAIQAVVTQRVIDGNTRMKDDEDIHKGLCFVVSLRRGHDDNTPSIFRSYKRHGVEETQCQIWEAARATTAAPGFFKAAKIKVGDKDEFFVDGAVRWNNPSRHVLSEAAGRFPSSNRRLGCLVSLGTGLRPPSLESDNQSERRWFRPTYKVKEIAKLALNSLTDPEPPHREIEDRLQHHPDSYFRFSVPYTPDEERVRIHEHEKMEILRRNTEEYLAKSDESIKIDEIVDILCRNRTTNLTLHSACHASTPETAAQAMDRLLMERKVVSSIFTGRDDILQLLDRIFHPRERGSSPRRDYLLWGVGGVGKTQIALRFIDRVADRFDKVLCIDASDVQMIHQSFEAIASDVLQHPGEAPHILPVLNWLNNTKEEWLLVIDNYNNGDITRYLPGYRKGNILFTSRRQNLPPQLPLGSTLQVPEMGPIDSARLLLRACRMDEDDLDLQEQVQPIVKELAGLPLALDTAGAHIYNGAQTFDQFLASLREERTQVLAEAPPGSEASKNPSIYATFELSLKCIKSYSRGSSQQARFSQSALQILNSFCFYHSESIPLEMIARAHGGINVSKSWEDIGLPTEADQGPGGRIFMGICGGNEPFDYAYVIGGLAVLLRFSLMKQPTEDPFFSIHPLVHSWLRDRMQPGSFDQNLRLARAVLYHSYHQQFRKPRAERYYLSLLPHMKANNEHQFKCEDATPFLQRMEMHWKYLQILKRSRLWDEAVPLIERDLRVWIWVTDRDDSESLSMMILLAEAYSATGRAIEAEDILRQIIDRSLSCPNKAWGKKCFVHVCGELAMVQIVQGNFGAAVGAAEVGVYNARRWGANMLIPITRLCLVYQYFERWNDALEHAETALKLRLQDRKQGPEHHSTIKAKAEVAYIRAKLGEFDVAETVLTETARKFEEDLGKDHYDTLVARTNLGWLYYAQNRLGEAEVVQREVLRIGRSVLGPLHLYTLYMLLRLALTLGEAGRYKKAIKLLTECVEGRTRLMWQDHPAVEGAHVWKLVFFGKMRGLDWACDLTEVQVKAFELGMKFAQHPYTPVQL